MPLVTQLEITLNAQERFIRTLSHNDSPLYNQLILFIYNPRRYALEKKSYQKIMSQVKTFVLNIVFEQKKCQRKHQLKIIDLIKYRIIIEMEKTLDLEILDNKIIELHKKYSRFLKNKSLYCYKADKKQISSFYSSMASEIFMQKIQKDQKNKGRRLTKKKGKNFQLRHSVDLNVQSREDNDQFLQIEVGKIQKMDPVPLRQVHAFSKKQSSSPFSVQIQEMEEYRQTILQKLDEIKKQKREDKKQKPSVQKTKGLFRKSFTLQKLADIKRKLSSMKYNRDQKQSAKEQGQKKVKFNKIFKKNFFKDEGIIEPFKTIFIERNADYISQNLINYLYKFQPKDHLVSKKMRFRYSQHNNQERLQKNQCRFSQNEEENLHFDDQNCIFISRPSNIDQNKQNNKEKPLKIKKKTLKVSF